MAAIFQNVKKKTTVSLHGRKNTKINFSEPLPSLFLRRQGCDIFVRPHEICARKSLSKRASESLPPRALFSPATAKRRGCIASLNWRIENNRAIPRGEREREAKRRRRGPREVSKASTAVRVQDLPRPSRCAFIARLDHERRKTSQGRPVLRSFPSRPCPSRPLDPPPRPRFTYLLFLNEHLLSGKSVWQLARACAHLILHRAL